MLIITNILQFKIRKSIVLYFYTYLPNTKLHIFENYS